MGDLKTVRMDPRGCFLWLCWGWESWLGGWGQQREIKVHSLYWALAAALAADLAAAGVPAPEERGRTFKIAPMKALGNP